MNDLDECIDIDECGLFRTGFHELPRSESVRHFSKFSWSRFGLVWDFGIFFSLPVWFFSVLVRVGPKFLKFIRSGPGTSFCPWIPGSEWESAAVQTLNVKTLGVVLNVSVTKVSKRLKLLTVLSAVTLMNALSHHQSVTNQQSALISLVNGDAVALKEPVKSLEVAPLNVFKMIHVLLLNASKAELQIH